MSFTRFNYDDCRTKKNLAQATGPGRYILNKPGWGNNPVMFNDPQMRMQQWGANLRSVPNSSAIDIHSDLLGITRQLKQKDCPQNQFPLKGVTKSYANNYSTYSKPITDESRATHPAWMYRSLEQTRKYPLFLNPQENVCYPFETNVNTRLLERDNFIPKIPKLPEN